MIYPRADICIEIEDNGSGIPREKLSGIFEPYFTTKEKGTGMGLAAAYGSIKQHSGTIVVKSEPGKGACFSIFLPLSTETAFDEEPVLSDRERPTEENRTIMIIDDEEQVLKATKFVLEHYKFKTVGFGDASKALYYYQKHSEEINVIILDLIMPAIDGEEVFKEIRKINPHASVIIVSGYSINSQARDLLDAGAKGFIQKPFRANTLMEMLTSIG